MTWIYGEDVDGTPAPGEVIYDDEEDQLGAEIEADHEAAEIEALVRAAGGTRAPDAPPNDSPW